ncbi:mechanosensitive ion channel family protein [Vibrio sp. 10N.261.46.E12]|uniref:mechanosensitive ion channel family protein n=3 Tax=Vibrio TaxID=662 RepID=UPI0009784B51|nr:MULTISPECIES: mechanosensitive ion channel family protein [unclassified Vibrio]OMO37389.1 mechanosensitive ion channel protein [Vibrio sp. 10N.261.45.E1]PMJ34237.1 mechanosensitive ion channel protein [Vibrio sp. 10N.286.45.B6]PMM72939.1 mechanosensitive ion channel protein [Vibrio sp. 10N.261.46.F12]PMM90560.1 mechanosensitive ion channel protein [Vibrio sp. 10N.261.46.E8]PMN42778.1 mechanosensitive ion channel protein [Vibrio sp. 10N.261.45.E2]
MIRDLLTYLFLMFALLVGAHSYASDVHSTQDQLINDLAALEVAHSSGETPTNEQEFLENILKRKNEHLRAQIDAIAAEPTDDESLSKLLSDQLDLMQRLLLLSETKIHQQAIEFRAAPDDEKSTLLVNLQRRSMLMDTYYGQLMATINQLESNAIPVDEAKAAFKQSVTERVDFLTNILLYKEAKIIELEQRSSFVSNNEALTQELNQQNEELEITLYSFESIIALMTALNIENADHLALLEQVQRHLNTDIIDVDVAYSFVEETLHSFQLWIVDKAPSLVVRLLLCLAILFAAKKIANLVAIGVGMSVKSAKMNFSVLMQNFFTSIVSKAVMFIGILVALSQVGIELGPLLTGLGVAGVIIGFALQDTLSNFASGLMILIYRPYDVGDLVKVNDIQGTVNKMSLVSTTIQTVDNQRLVIPNNKIWGDVINNITAESIRRVDMVFGIGYQDDIDKAKKVFMDILTSDPRVLETPEPMVRVHSLNDSSVDFVVRPWVNTVDYWEVYWDMTEKVKKSLDQEGISIPFPQRDVHIYNHKVD